MSLYVKYRFLNKFNLTIDNKSDIPNEYICISFFNECFYTHIHVYKMHYAFFILIIYISEHLLQNDDDISCVTELTGTTGPSFITKDLVQPKTSTFSTRALF